MGAFKKRCNDYALVEFECGDANPPTPMYACWQHLPNGVGYARHSTGAGRWCYKTLGKSGSARVCLPSDGLVRPHLMKSPAWKDTCVNCLTDPPPPEPTDSEENGCGDPLTPPPGGWGVNGVESSSHPGIWGVPIPGGPTTGNISYYYGNMCIVFNFSGVWSPPPPGAVVLTIGRDACNNCIQDEFFIPLYYCGSQPLPAHPLQFFTRETGAPTVPVVGFLMSGFCLGYDPNAPRVVRPQNALAVPVPTEGLTCGGCVLGINAVPCVNNIASVIPGAPKLWIRQINIPATPLVDVFEGIRYHIDPESMLVPRPAGSQEWHPKGDYETCSDAKCNLEPNKTGIAWKLCPTEPSRKGFIKVYTLTENLPATIIHRRLENGMCIFLNPADPIVKVRPGQMTLGGNINEFPDCRKCVNTGGPPGNGDPEPDTDGDGDSDDPDNPNPPPGEDGKKPQPPGDPDNPPNPCPGCGNGPCTTCPPPPGDNPGELGDDDGTKPNKYCKENPEACFNHLVSCKDGTPLGKRYPNLPRGWVIQLLVDKQCYVNVADPDVNPDDPAATLKPPLTPDEIMGMFYNCSFCPKSYCYSTWKCTGGVVSHVGVECTSDDLEEDWYQEDGGTDWFKVVKGAECDPGVTVCAPGPAPAPPPGCVGCGPCPQIWKDIFGETEACYMNESGWKMACKSKLRLQWNAASAGEESGTTLQDHFTANGLPFPLIGDQTLDMYQVDSTFTGYFKEFEHEGHTFNAYAHVNRAAQSVVVSILKTTGMYGALHWTRDVGWDFPLELIGPLPNGDAFVGESDHGVWAVIDTFDLYYIDGTEVMATIQNNGCCVNYNLPP